jgi:hypothetical protein
VARVEGEAVGLEVYVWWVSMRDGRGDDGHVGGDRGVCGGWWSGMEWNGVKFQRGK